eukprot:scaffold72266_cov53-Phaeocystis_antarctica.AAC.5
MGTKPAKVAHRPSRPTKAAKVPGLFPRPKTFLQKGLRSAGGPKLLKRPGPAPRARGTMLKVLCGVMQFWFDIDGQRATPAVFIPGFGSIFPKSRRRVTECCPPSKLSKFTRFYGL